MTTFAQVVKIIPREMVTSIAQQWETDRYSKTLDTWTHLIMLLFAQLSGCNSLRDVVNGIRSMEGHLNHLGIEHAPSRNALSHQNATRDWRVFREIYNTLYKYLRQQLHCSREVLLPKGRAVTILDSTTVTLCLELFPWADYQQEKGAIKLHTLFSTRTLLPLDILVSEGKKADNMGAYGVFPGKRSVVVADRGYCDSELWNDWDSNGITFVVRNKKDLLYERVRENEQPDEGEQDILIDEVITLSGEKTSQNYTKPLRRIAVYKPYEQARKRRRKYEEEAGEQKQVDGEVIELMTNNMTWSAETISQLYRSRWEIETFFKLLKQYLKVTSFLGTTKNAVMCQIWAAMIAVLILRYLKSLSSVRWAMGSLINFLRITLLGTRNLYDWLARPFDMGEIPPNFKLTCT